MSKNPLANGGVAVIIKGGRSSRTTQQSQVIAGLFASAHFRSLKYPSLTMSVAVSRTLRQHCMRRTNGTRKPRISPIRTREYKEADLPILGEVLFAAELVLLHAAPLYYGFGIPHGDNSAVILIPAFLCPDAYLAPLHQWLARIGYKPFFSGIGFNTECPNLLIRQQLNGTIEKGACQDRMQGSPDRPQPWRHHRPCDCGPTARGHCFRHHIGGTVQENGRPLQHPAYRQASSTAHSGKAWHRCAPRMLYRALHL